MRNILEKTVNFQEKHEKFVRKSSFIRFSLSNLKTKSELRFRVFVTHSIEIHRLQQN